MCIRDRQRAGTIDANLDVLATAIVLTSMVERSISVGFMSDAPIGDDQLAHALGRAIWLIVYGSGPDRSD